MAYFIGDACIDTMDRSCMQECPVDCIYEGAHKLYIQPDECVDCGACLSVCPVDAVDYHLSGSAEVAEARADNARFFAEPLPGRDAPLGSPGGSGRTGVVGVDTPRVRQIVAARAG